jgi:cell wall-associated NlpC family hydrolase
MVMRRGKGLLVAMIMVLAFTMCFAPSFAVASDGGAKTTASKKAPGVTKSLSYSVSGKGVMRINWSKVSRATKYWLVRKSPSGDSVTVYKGKKCSYIEDGAELDQTGTYKYYLRAKNSAGTGDAKTLAFSYVSPDGMYISQEEMTINKGKSRKLHISWGIDSPNLFAYENAPMGRWKSSDTSVAKVSSSGKVKAVGHGECDITFYDVAGYHKTCHVTVPFFGRAAGSMYIENLKYANMESLLASDEMIKGRQNRLNGTLRSDTTVRKFTVKIYNKSGRTELKYTKKIGAKSYDLTKLNNAIEFNDLSKGKKTIKVWASNGRAKALLYEHDFKVGSTPARSEKGEEIVKWGLTRRGDPYSQPRRGELNFTDCSWLVRWSYKQGANKSIPYTAATQYKYCVQHHKTVKRKNLKPGDIVFFGGWSNGRYKGIYHAAVYVGNGLIVHTARPLRVTSINIWRAKKYYGRPY